MYCIFSEKYRTSWVRSNSIRIWYWR